MLKNYSGILPLLLVSHTPHGFKTTKHETHLSNFLQKFIKLTFRILRLVKMTYRRKSISTRLNISASSRDQCSTRTLTGLTPGRPLPRKISNIWTGISGPTTSSRKQIWQSEATVSKHSAYHEPEKLTRNQPKLEHSDAHNIQPILYPALISKRCQTRL